MAEAENFMWCTADCGSGQIHSSGADQPIVTCLNCQHRFCFQHKVPWHDSLTCSEYDRLLADPDNFRSNEELENEEQQQLQLESDRTMARELLAEQEVESRRKEAREKAERDRTRRAVELRKRIAARQRKEEQETRVTIGMTTKACPGCGAAIEKNSGW